MKRYITLTFLMLSAPFSPVIWGAQLVFFAESPRGLYDFNTNTGVSTFRAPVAGAERFFGMDRRPSDGAVFAVDLFGSGLWTININTGQTNRIGTLTPFVDRPEGIAFDPRNGDLYVSSVLGDLYRVNPNTAATIFVGGSGLTIRGHSFSPDGSRFLAFREGTGGVYLVDPATAAATLVGPGIAGGLPEDSTFTLAGEFFGTDFHGAIYRVNPNTGVATLIAPTGFGDGLLGLVELPEPGALALIAGAIATTFLLRGRTRASCHSRR